MPAGMCKVLSCKPDVLSLSELLRKAYLQRSDQRENCWGRSKLYWLKLPRLGLLPGSHLSLEYLIKAPYASM